MDFDNFIVWLSAGAVIGWFPAGWMMQKTGMPTNQSQVRIAAPKRAKHALTV